MCYFGLSGRNIAHNVTSQVNISSIGEGVVELGARKVFMK